MTPRSVGVLSKGTPPLHIKKRSLSPSTMDANMNSAHAMAMAALTNQTPPPPLPHHHHFPLHHHQNPMYQPYPAPQTQTGPDFINTLFISGLPFDVKAREIHNLFRRRHGFDFCQLEYTGRANQVVAFATFFNHQSAVTAMNALNGATFDPQSGSILHIELARSNSRSKRSRGTEAYFIVDKRHKASIDNQEASNSDGDEGSDQQTGTDNPAASNKDNLPTAESTETTGDTCNVGVAENEQSEKNVPGEPQPCSTLFIANLGPNCTEAELKQALSQYPGFHMVKMRANRGMPVAFADFEEVGQATEAMQGLQDSMLPSSDRGGMHLEYARSKMRKA